MTLSKAQRILLLAGLLTLTVGPAPSSLLAAVATGASSTLPIPGNGAEDTILRIESDSILVEPTETGSKVTFLGNVHVSGTSRTNPASQFVAKAPQMIMTVVGGILEGEQGTITKILCTGGVEIISDGQKAVARRAEIEPELVEGQKKGRVRLLESARIVVTRPDPRTINGPELVFWLKDAAATSPTPSTPKTSTAPRPTAIR